MATCKFCEGKGEVREPVLLRWVTCTHCEGTGLSYDTTQTMKVEEAMEKAWWARR